MYLLRLNKNNTMKAFNIADWNVQAVTDMSLVKFKEKCKVWPDQKKLNAKAVEKLYWKITGKKSETEKELET